MADTTDSSVASAASAANEVDDTISIAKAFFIISAVVIVVVVAISVLLTMFLNQLNAMEDEDVDNETVAEDMMAEGAEPTVTATQHYDYVQNIQYVADTTDWLPLQFPNIELLVPPDFGWFFDYFFNIIHLALPDYDNRIIINANPLYHFDDFNLFMGSRMWNADFVGWYFIENANGSQIYREVNPFNDTVTYYIFTADLNLFSFFTVGLSFFEENSETLDAIATSIGFSTP